MINKDGSLPENAPVTAYGLVVAFVPSLQSVTLQFNPEHFHTWEFVIGVLHMAIIEAERQRNIALIAKAQQIQERETIREIGRHDSKLRRLE